MEPLITSSNNSMQAAAVFPELKSADSGQKRRTIINFGNSKQVTTRNLSLSKPHVSEFLQSLLLPGKNLHGSPQLTFTAIHPGQDRHPVPSRHSKISDWHEIYQNILDLNHANRSGWGAFFGIAYRKEGLDRWHRGGKNDLFAIPALFADIDKINIPIADYLRDLPQPSWIVQTSSKSFHVYWLLNEASQELRRADYILHGIAKYLGADGSMTIDNPLRLPGSINTKAEAYQSLCKIIFAAPDNRYELAQFSRWQEITKINHPITPDLIIPSHRPQSTKTYPSNEELNPDLIKEICRILLQSYDGHYKQNGWIESYAPCHHKKDRHPGDHFNFDPRSGMGFCYGRHGTLYTHQVANLLGIRISDYGKLFVRKAKRAL